VTQDLPKVDAIEELLARLSIQERGWVVVDHWEADRCATGIASVRDSRRLVYVSVFERLPDRYAYGKPSTIGVLFAPVRRWHGSRPCRALRCPRYRLPRAGGPRLMPASCSPSTPALV
jgi:hypothetical protein